MVRIIIEVLIKVTTTFRREFTKDAWGLVIARATMVTACSTMPMQGTLLDLASATAVTIFAWTLSFRPEESD